MRPVIYYYYYCYYFYYYLKRSHLEDELFYETRDLSTGAEGDAALEVNDLERERRTHDMAAALHHAHT